jgi:hypothetical protein
MDNKFLFHRKLDPSKVAIIREVYDSENSHETFELELERALEAGCSVIIVEPSRLGDETARWIAVGNCLHKTAVLSGIGAIATGRYCLTLCLQVARFECMFRYQWM